MNIKRYEVFANEDELHQLHQLRDRFSLPLMGVTNRHTRLVAESIDRARDDFYALVDDVAVRGGLPPPGKDSGGYVIHYGADLTNGQILGVLVNNKQRIWFVFLLVVAVVLWAWRIQDWRDCEARGGVYLRGLWDSYECLEKRP